MPPVPGGLLVGVPPMFTPGVVPGRGELLGLASLPRVIGLGPRSRAPGPTPPTVAGGATPVLPAPPVTTWATAGPIRAMLRAPASAIMVRVMRSSVLQLMRHGNGRGAVKFEGRFRYHTLHITPAMAATTSTMAIWMASRPM